MLAKVYDCSGGGGVADAAAYDGVGGGDDDGVSAVLMTMMLLHWYLLNQWHRFQNTESYTIHKICVIP